MKSGVFYLSYAPGKDRQQINLANGAAVWIRVEEIDGTLLDVLDKARPRAGEHVMNSHNLPDIGLHVMR